MGEVGLLHHLVNDAEHVGEDQFTIRILYLFCFNPLTDEIEQRLQAFLLFLYVGDANKRGMAGLF